MTTFEQAWRDVYGSVEAWERERHGTVEQATRERYRHLGRRGTLRDRFAQELADTREAERLKRERRT